MFDGIFVFGGLLVGVGWGSFGRGDLLLVLDRTLAQLLVLYRVCEVSSLIHLLSSLLGRHRLCNRLGTFHNHHHLVLECGP